MEKIYEALADLEEIVKKKDAIIAAQALIIEDLTRRLDARQGDLRTSFTFGRSEDNASEDLYNATPPANATALAPANDLQPPPGYRVTGLGSFPRFTRWDVKPPGWDANENNIHSDKTERGETSNTLHHLPAPADLKKEPSQHDGESDNESTGSNIQVAGLRTADGAASPEFIESYNDSGTGSFMQFIDLSELYNAQLQRPVSTPPTSPRDVYKRFPFRPDRPVKSTEQPTASAPEPRRTSRISRRKQFPDCVVDQSLSKRVKRD